MIPIRFNDEEGIRFMKCYFEGLDELINYVIGKKISAKEALIYIWMSSFAWKEYGKKERNQYKKSIRKMANWFGVEKVSMERNLKNLAKAELIQPIYRVDFDGVTKTYTNHAKAWEQKNKKGGISRHTFFEIRDDAFIVETGKDGQKFKSTRDEAE